MVLDALNYRIYVDGVIRQTVIQISFDLAELNLEEGTYSIKIRAVYNSIESPLSSAVEFTVEPTS